ncbi:hypothetical protein [Spirosoma oryzicola]|uniref:hypothetical protein n=1 Tax=Spirosoma oryzicola TaxID=2898794 RepID=UPI001E5B96D8|nr:hypothetical protein [Spirosoma oryzicola]UHG94477.1 hypothetical protein LQ777_28220 [Spirosoma oryzicola]
MRFSYSIVTALLITISLPGCDIAAIGPDYNLGKFTSRSSAEHKALAYLADRYGELSNSKYEKVRYTFTQSNPVAGPDLTLQHILWYSKTEQTIKIEADPGSGPRCSWTQIDQSALNQLVIRSQGLSLADSLGKSTGASYFQCVDN